MGGAEVFTREVAKRWVEGGHEVTLFTSEFPGCRREETVDGVRILRSGGKYAVYWQAKRQYRRCFKGKFDVVIDEINTRPFFAPGFVEEPVVALIHQLAREYWFYETPFPVGHIGYHFLEPRWLRKYVDIPTITVSESTRRDLMDLGFKKVHVVSEGVGFQPLDEVPEKEERPICLYVGRLTKAKRPHHAIKALGLVRREVADAELWMVGDGYLRRNLEEKAPEGVEFLGRVPEEEKMELMRRAWVLVNPSVREGFGLNVIEANACGTPCVAYDVAGLRDLIRNGETGLLVESNGFEGLAEAIKKILKENGLRMRLSRNALKYSRRLDWEKTAMDTMKILKSSINGFG